ncbi:MAG: IQ calmodulin-binding motif-containing protein, partial [Candidatus Margulisiibacteriota bacterium]
SLFNAFALFLTRLLNELPTGNKRQTDLIHLRHKLTPLFQKMEAEYDSKGQDIRHCDFINNRILSTAQTATGSCIDKIKVGYLFMQLFLNENFQQDLTTMATIIKTVEDIKHARVVFDASTNQFIHVANTTLVGSFDANLKLQAKYLLKLTDDSRIELTDDEMTQLNNIGAFNMDNNTLTQLLYSAISHQNPLIKAIRIGDEVEDILNLAYKLLNDDFHKIDMRFSSCCSLKNATEPAGLQFETASMAFIQEALHLQQHNAATAIQKQVRGFLVRKN